MGTAGERLIARDHRAHLIEQQLGRHASEVGEGIFQSSNERMHILPDDEAQPQEAREAQHGEERIALPHGSLISAKIDLGLMARGGFEAHHRFRDEARAYVAHEHLQLGEAARVPVGLAFGEEPDGREPGYWVRRASMTASSASSLVGTSGRGLRYRTGL